MRGAWCRAVLFCVGLLALRAAKLRALYAPARVAKSVDAAVLNTADSKGSCPFESGPGHHMHLRDLR